MDAALKERIETIINQDKVLLFMKGTPLMPQCGFSNQVVQILKAFDIPFGHCNILEDLDMRQGMKDFSDWPTFPQLYIEGEFVGGCDIVMEAWQSGELAEWLQEAFPDKKIEGPEPPAQPKNISPQQAKEMMDRDDVRFLDVRTRDERETAAVEGFDLLDQALAEKLLESEDKETPLVFMCHRGGRSQQAAEFFAARGFKNCLNVQGGIDAWSTTVDSSVPRY